jgi:aspartate ammonia-lyase
LKIKTLEAMTTKTTSKFRTESDLLGSKEVPEEALYGVQTTRAIENFHISGNLMVSYPNFIKGMAITKKAAALANYEVGMITVQQANAICQACGYHNERWITLDIYQRFCGLIPRWKS